MGGRKFVGRNKEMQFDLKLFYYSAFIVTWQPETSFYLRTMLWRSVILALQEIFIRILIMWEKEM